MADQRAQAIKELKLAKKTFVVVSKSLVEQLSALFPGSPVLAFLKGELERFVKDPKEIHVPAVKYFQTMNLATKVKPTVERGPLGAEGSTIVVGELILRQDPVIFTDDVGVVIPELEALGMKEKWPKLKKANQDMVWDYLIRMAKTSAQVVIGMQLVDGRLASVVKTLSDKGVSAHPGMSEKELAEFAEHVKSACADA